MTDVQSGHPAENGCYTKEPALYNLTVLASRIFRVQFYNELFPKYDTWSKTNISFHGSIENKGDVAYMPELGVRNRPLCADREATTSILFTEELLQLDRGNYATTFEPAAVELAKKIRYANLGTWSRFACQVCLSRVSEEFDMRDRIVIRCVYGLEFK